MMTDSVRYVSVIMMVVCGRRSWMCIDASAELWPSLAQYSPELATCTNGYDQYIDSYYMHYLYSL